MDHFDTPRLARAEGLRRRRAVTGTERNEREARLCSRIAKDPFVKSASSIGLYLADDGEPDLAGLVSVLRDCDKLLALPVLDDDPTSFEMRFCAWPVQASIVPGRFGIGAPEPQVVCVPDLILVPLVGFDGDGNRVGRGAGFFDRYLAASSAVTVGVGFACQQFEQLPVQPHDVPLGAVITEDETLRSQPQRPNKK